MNPLIELQEWYASHCDGDWEHSHGIRIESLDNPGWLLQIDLSGTEVESAEFEPILIDTGMGSWANIQIKEDVWQAACDPRGLEAAIKTFLEWTRRA